MSKRFTRNIRSIKDIEKQPKYTNKQNDLLSDDKHVYVRNKDQYEQITGGVKEVNGETPDENGHVNLQIKDLTGQEKLVRKNQLDEALEEIESGYKQYTDDKVQDIVISERNLLKDSANKKSGKLHEKNPSQAEYDYLNVGKSLDDLSSGTTITISFDIETTELGIDSLMIYNANHKGPKGIEEKYVRDIPAGITRQSVTTLVRDNDNPDQEDNNIEFFTKYDTGQLFEITNISINKGSYAFDWKPNPYEIVTQDQYDKLANAIINLGGSL